MIKVSITTIINEVIQEILQIRPYGYKFKTCMDVNKKGVITLLGQY